MMRAMIRSSRCCNCSLEGRPLHETAARHGCADKPHRAPSNADECSATTTLNTMPSTVTVHYPFHPLINRCLKLITWPRHPANAATVEHPDGKTLKIPLWMLQPDAARFHLCERVELSSSALDALVDL